MRITSLIIFLLALAILSSCKKIKSCFASSSENVSIEKVFAKLDKVEINGNFNVTLIQDSLNFLAYETKDLINDFVSYHENNGTIKIDNNIECKGRKQNQKFIPLTIHYEQLNQIIISDNCQLQNKEIWVQDNIQIIAKESTGKIVLKLKSKESSFKLLGGTCDATIKGNSDFVYAYSVGFGAIDLFDASCYEAGIYNSSSGYIKINAKNKLNVEIDNSGNVYYKGNPQIQLTKYPAVSKLGELIAK